jgi:L-asparaginase II
MARARPKTGDIRLDGELFVEVRRGARIESRHRVAVCAVNISGRTLCELGTVDVPVFLRSAAKPFIAGASVRAGVIDAFEFDDRELALMCASHAAEPEHIETVLSMLGKAGIPASALQCGGAPSALYNNCSGKHAGILALAKLIGAPLETYLEPDNPAQIEILALCERVIREPLPPDRIAVDGCGIPVFATSLRRAACAFARLATLEDLEDRDKVALARVRAAMIANPWYVSGTGRLDTALIEAGGGAIVSKGGAEAVHCDALVALGAGIALKVVDGNSRATAPALLAVLERLGALDATALQSLKRFSEPQVHNVAGRVVGSIRAHLEPEPLTTAKRVRSLAR